MLDPHARTRRRGPDEDFFVEGNYLRFERLKKRVSAPGSSPEVIQYESDQHFVCSEVGCGQTFCSLVKFEEHRFRCHSHVCSVCGKSFTSDRLLSFHISELHDNYFAAVSKRKPSYLCLVVGCEEVFWSNGDRRLHLISQHKYHPSYDFHNPRRYMQTFKKKSTGETHAGPKNSAQYEQTAGTIKPAESRGQTSQTAFSDSMQVEEVDKPAKGEGNRAQRRAQKKLLFEAQQHAQHPSSCVRSVEGTPLVAVPDEVFEGFTRPYACSGALVESGTSLRNDGESRGDQRGCAIGRATGRSGDTLAEGAMVVEDDGMDSLVQGMRQVSVKVPSTISFGRRKRHGHS